MNAAMGDPEAGKAPRQERGSAPSVNLPKGGGALRGIGEKFAANPVSGTGTLTVPIATSPGRTGFGPRLVLSYDSGSGNGPFGLGWSLPLPAITRKTDRGLPRYLDRAPQLPPDGPRGSAPPDVFILSDFEDLVPVPQDGAAAGAGPGGSADPGGSPDHCGPREDDGAAAGYRVERFRPRIEGEFARIERWTGPQGEVHWRSLTRDNVLTLYGTDPSSRVADPARPERVFSWLISRSFDDKGNAVLYQWDAEDDREIDTARPSEARRCRGAGRYLRRIRYGNRVPLLIDPAAPSLRRSHLEPLDLEGAGWMFEVLFDYGEEYLREEAPDQEGRLLVQGDIGARRPWPARRDPFSSYRSGFEIRTHRLCRRVLMLHRFPGELGADPCLVRSSAFEYREKPTGTQLVRVLQSGHRLLADGRYLTRSLPPLELSYTQSPLEDSDFAGYRLQVLDRGSLARLPAGIDGTTRRFVDLDGEGISGVLSTEGAGWFYQPNLGGGRLGPGRGVDPVPSLAGAGGEGPTLMDLSGDGELDLVQLPPELPGYQERREGGWEGFRPFRSLPVRDWDDPNLRFVDLTGNGIADLLASCDDELIWHPSLLSDGFGAGERVPLPLDEEQGPRVLFADQAQSVYLADLTGDGLSDILRVRNAEICYWPNLGYGRFGAKVVMENAPRLDRADLFDQGRLRLADTDGSGTADLVYLGADGVRVYLNHSGNGWSEARELPGAPGVDSVGSVAVADLLGRGTACLVWSDPLPRQAVRPVRYLDLTCGVKPHLLERVVNNLGAETRIAYASSTESYLADKEAGTPWITRLPFPVQVVQRVETLDALSRNRFVTRYSYHHGFYDGAEREFRGFGRVEQLDTEELAVLTRAGELPAADNEDPRSSVPPVLTKSWFHTGVYPGGDKVSRHLAHEYYREGSGREGEAPLSPEQAEALLLPDTLLPEGLTPEEAREACRSLKGVLLRQEVYALDGSEAAGRPYTVTENNYAVRLLQRRGTGSGGHHAVFLPHAREALTCNYERRLYPVEGDRRPDPRVAHQVVLEADDFGNVLRSVSIGYGRRFPDPSPYLGCCGDAQQSRTRLALLENRYTNPVREPEAYRAPLPAGSRLYELVGAAPGRSLPGVSNLFSFEELAEIAEQASDGSHDLPFEDWEGTGAAGGVPWRRLVQESRVLYRSNALDRLLPLGVLESLGLAGENYRLAFTPQLLAGAFARSAPGAPQEALLPDPPQVLASRGEDGGGYRDLDGDGRWWIPGGRVFFHREPGAPPEEEREEALAHFFLPRRVEDPFGHGSTLDYDPHDYFTVATVDALGNRVATAGDYRVLQTRQVTDQNGNRIESLFDTLGLACATAVRGKEGEELGDTLEGVEPDPPAAAIEAFLADPAGAAPLLLGQATSRVVYDLERYRLAGAPSLAASLARETHVSDLAGQPSRIQIAFSYSDGFGREIQRKLQAEPGPLVPDGPALEARWVGSGWTVYNNKGKPVRRYEPFFDDSHAFRFGVAVGVSPILFYDPLERLVATLHPDHSYQKTVFDPWGEQHFDVNDTVNFDPRVDPDLRGFFLKLPEAEYLPTWHALRTDPAHAARAHELWPDPREFEAQKKAAHQAALHAGTPALSFLDSLGRVFLTVAQNRYQRRQPDGGSLTVEEGYLTRVELDLEGNQRAVVDALGRLALRADFDLLGNRIRHATLDSGEHWLLTDASGSPIRAWDSRGQRFRYAYDPLRRRTGLHLQGAQGREITAGRTVYGEGAPEAEARNLRGRELASFDQSGTVSYQRYDFKGNLLASRRTLAREFRGELDWSGEVELEEESFLGGARYDALNRPVELTTPHTPQMRPNLVRPSYNEAGLLERVEANLQGAGEPTVFIEGIEYDPRGQRLSVGYGNGARTSYRYDPLTFRLTRLATRRDPARFPGDCPDPPAGGWPGCRLQNLSYVFDPVGNLVQIRDDAQQTVFFANRRVEPDGEYLYDAVYRLIEATGREHLGQGGIASASSWDDRPRTGGLLSGSDGQAMGRYLERYRYDPLGNLESVAHRGSHAAKPSWTRRYSYREASPLEPGRHSNRLSATTVHPGGREPVSEPYAYDPHGNTVRMPHLQEMAWDFNDQLRMTRRQAVQDADAEGPGGAGERTWYRYDEEGERVRKVTELPSGEIKEERLYLGGLEIYRRHGRDPLTRETLHIAQERQTLALVETRTKGDDPGPAVLCRYQLGNHLGSAVLELDDRAQVVSYEEYFPFGSTSFQATRSHTETPKRYRFAGMERDEESGLNCHGVRYYATWLGRWLSADPAGLEAGMLPYCYAANSPVTLVDVTGRSPDKGPTFALPPRYHKKWGSTQTLPLPGPRKKAGSAGAAKKKGAEGGEKGGVEGGEEGGVAGGKVGGTGEEIRTGKSPPGTGTGAGNPSPPGTAPGTGGDPGQQPPKDPGGGSGPEGGTGKGTAPGGKPGGIAGGSAGGKAGGAQQKQEGKQDAPTGEKPVNPGEDSLLGDIAALAALIADPDSLYQAKKNGNTGKGAQIGRKNGLISGWLGQVLVVLMVFGEKFWKGLKAFGGMFKRGYNSIKNKLFGTVEQKALKEGLDQTGLVNLFGQGADDAESVLNRLEAGEMINLPEGVTPKMLSEYRAAAEANIAEVSGLNIINKDEIIATQSLRIQIIDILLARFK